MTACGLFLLLEHARRNGIFDLIDHDLVFETQSTNRIKLNHIKTILCGSFVGIDKRDTYAAKGAAGMIQEIIAHLKEDLEIIFCMDSYYFAEDILETTESLSRRCVIKGKAYPTLVARIADPDIIFDTDEEGRKTTELVTTLNTWEKDRRFIIHRVLKERKLCYS